MTVILAKATTLTAASTRIAVVLILAIILFAAATSNHAHAQSTDTLVSNTGQNRSEHFRVYIFGGLGPSGELMSTMPRKSNA